MKKTCPWPRDDVLMVGYHDIEWGVPLHDDRKLFEFLVLDGFQAGLSWSTILHKREDFRKAFRNFDPGKVAAFGKQDVERLMKDARIVRNRLKIKAAVTNARAFIRIQQEFGSFDRFIWQFTGGRQLPNRWKSLKQIPVRTPQSDAMSKELTTRGFSFVGSTICYAFMQAAGMVNDHLVYCYRHREVQHQHENPNAKNSIY
jgi:DNA-3-methyladenine glycosylase I